MAIITRSQDQAQDQDTASSSHPPPTSSVAMLPADAAATTTTTRTVTLAAGFPTNDKTISIHIPVSSSSTLRAAGHHIPYLSFENFTYEYSHADESAGIFTFLCPRAPHPDPKKDVMWISTRSWYAEETSRNTNSQRMSLQSKIIGHCILYPNLKIEMW